VGLTLNDCVQAKRHPILFIERIRIMFKQSKTLASLYGIKHGFYGKKGGVSEGIYDSLNCGFASLDSVDNIIENRWRALHGMGLQETKLFGLKQIHSIKVHVIKSKSEDLQEGDALVTKVKGLSLSILSADCAPILFADRKAGVIAAAHAGWRGAVSGIVESVVLEMCGQGATRENIHACIGPTIYQDSFEVQNDFIVELEKLSDFETQKFIKTDKNKRFFDLPAYILTQCSLSRINSESLEIDTYTNENEYFSFRRNTHASETEYGRQISIISLV